MRVETADDSPCEVEPVGKLVFGKWTSHLLWAIAHDGPISFSALCASAPRTEYQITRLGRSLIPIFRELVRWSDQNLAEVSQARVRYDGGTNIPTPPRTPSYRPAGG